MICKLISCLKDQILWISNSKIDRITTMDGLFMGSNLVSNPTLSDTDWTVCLMDYLDYGATHTSWTALTQITVVIENYIEYCKRLVTTGLKY